MSRPRSTNRTLALKMWLKSGRKMKLSEIADDLGVSDSLIRKWKHLDKWDDIPAKRPRGAQRGNQNAVGNKGGAPEGNQNAVKHGLFRKFLPDDPEFQELIEIAEELDPIDLLWQNVKIAYAKLIRAQKIMFVRDHDDMTKEIKKTESMDTEGMSVDKQEWEIQFAWDKQATDISAYTKISREFRSAVKHFLAAVPENDERRAKLELLETKVDKSKTEHERLKLQVEEMGGSKNTRKLESFL